MNGDWEHDKELCRDAILCGTEVLTMLELVYKYGYADGKNDGLECASKIISGTKHD